MWMCDMPACFADVEASILKLRICDIVMNLQIKPPQDTVKF